MTFKLLTVGNPKIAKGTKFGFFTAVLHLAPANLSGYEVCAKATEGCRAACLNTAGRGGIMAGLGILTYAAIIAGNVNAIQKARIRRTRWYFEDRAGFMQALADDIAKLVALAGRHGLRPAIRLNGTSDIPWERVRFRHVGDVMRDGDHANIMDAFPDVQFYDYTKRPNRRDLPANYHLTFSLAEGNDGDAFTALENGMNVAAVFHAVPTRFDIVQPDGGERWPIDVIDGDEHDLRFLDKRGVVVGLKAKGNAKRDTTGFVR